MTPRPRSAKGRFIAGTFEAPLEARFWAKVSPEPNTGCWIWAGGLTQQGYGAIGLGAASAGVMLAHRLSWTFAVGPIPRGKWVLHRCDNRWCVNPAHLFLGSRQDNIDDCVSKRRNRWPLAAFGEAHHAATTTVAQAKRVKAHGSRGGKTRKEIAAVVGVSKWVVDQILTGKTWRHAR